MRCPILRVSSGGKLVQYLDSGERLLMPKQVAAEGDMLFIAELQLLCLRARASERPPFSTLRSAIRNALTTEQGTYMGKVADGDDDDAENAYLRYNAVSNILQNESGTATLTSFLNHFARGSYPGLCALYLVHTFRTLIGFCNFRR